MAEMERKEKDGEKEGSSIRRRDCRLLLGIKNCLEGKG